MRWRSGLLAEKAREVRRVGKTKLSGDVVDLLGGEDEPALSFDKNALANEMARSHARRALDVVVEPIDRHAEFFGVKSQQALLAEELIDQRAQSRDSSVIRIQRNAATARVARCQPRHADGDQH